MVVVVALSGGVDSAVAAAVLKKSWPRLIGASHIIWPASRCCSEEVLDRAREVCRRLDIPYLQVDLFPEFRERVVGNFIESYLEGRTPNPCVLCNGFIRFDLFYDRLKSILRERGMLGRREKLFLATGHYARIVKTSEGFFIGKGRDRGKDQSYMLYRVNREKMANLLLPLGEYLKNEVTVMAQELELPFGRVRESQDACFVEHGYVDFIREATGRSDFLRPGEIVDLEGQVLGRHRGTIHYTVGQRRGLGLGSGPWYVARINAQENRVIVARRERACSREFTVYENNWFIDPPGGGLPCGVKIRYQVMEVPCTVEPAAGRFRVTLQRPEIVSPGQSAVFYRDGLVLGGGIIA